MRKPNDFKKSFLINQGMGTVAYMIVGATIYAFGGQYVTSPAFTMASRPVYLVAYSLALVTIILSGILAVNIGAKYLYVGTLRDSPLLTSGGWKAHFIWMGMVSLLWAVGFIVSQLVPFFNQLLTIISSLFSVWLTYGSAGIMWNWDQNPLFGNERRMTKWKWFLGGIAQFTVSRLLACGADYRLYSPSQSPRSGYTLLWRVSRRAMPRGPSNTHSRVDAFI